MLIIKTMDNKTVKLLIGLLYFISIPSFSYSKEGEKNEVVWPKSLEVLPKCKIYSVSAVLCLNKTIKTANIPLLAASVFTFSILFNNCPRHPFPLCFAPPDDELCHDDELRHALSRRLTSEYAVMVTSQHHTQICGNGYLTASYSNTG